MATNRLNGTIISLDDGNTVETKVPTRLELERCLKLMLTDMAKRRNMLVGFAIESKYDSFSRKVQVTMVKLCTELGCILVRLNGSCGDYAWPHLRMVMGMKEPIFAGVHIKEGLKMLREDHGIVVGNVVDLSELAARVMKKPSLVAYGARGLAVRVANANFDSKYLFSSITTSVEPLSLEDIEYATIDVYAAYKVAEKILGSDSDDAL
ncbi:Protein RISC-INTERACTING CLEARING 3'-5' EXORIBONUCLEASE 1 [Linum perenne]